MYSFEALTSIDWLSRSVKSGSFTPKRIKKELIRNQGRLSNWLDFVIAIQILTFSVEEEFIWRLLLLRRCQCLAGLSLLFFLFFVVLVIVIVVIIVVSFVRVVKIHFSIFLVVRGIIVFLIILFPLLSWSNSTSIVARSTIIPWFCFSSSTSSFLFRTFFVFSSLFLIIVTQYSSVVIRIIFFSLLLLLLLRSTWLFTYCPQQNLSFSKPQQYYLFFYFTFFISLISLSSCLIVECLCLIFFILFLGFFLLFNILFLSANNPNYFSHIFPWKISILNLILLLVIVVISGFFIV